MRQALLIISLVASCVIGLFGCCAALIDWVQDYQGGVYASHPLEAILKTGLFLATPSLVYDFSNGE
jgi:hypothetical protein